MTEKSVAERLAEVTGKSVEEFEADEYELPDWEDLEFVKASEYYDRQD